jgi:hypothetical protein
MYEFALDKKKNNTAHTFGKYLNKSSYNNICRMIKYIAFAIVLMGRDHSAYCAFGACKRTPILDPGSVPTRSTVKVLSCTITLHNTRNKFRVCVTDIESTHGLCHYMNTTEEEDRLPDNNIDIDAGVFAFPPSTFPVNDTVQLCVKSIPIHIKRCVWDKNEELNRVTKYGADRSSFKPTSGIVQRPKIMNYTNLGGGIV